MCNEKIRQEMKRSGIYCWQLADALNVAESTFYRMMRYELPEKRREEPNPLCVLKCFQFYFSSVLALRF